MVHFSGKARKMNHVPPLARAKRAREPAVWILSMVSNIILKISRISRINL
ncbi:MAG: hypothetical protein U5L45_26120 [Saprospiraceae bacterium]|nr:hypothetical protein [Saprospiraceae bacterium]